MTSVSVITPNYNYALYIESAVKSVLSQTVKIDEYFVVDDCSTDNSIEIVSSLAGNFKFIKNSNNLGIVENFRRCIERTNSDYICFVGADNCIDPSYIEKLKFALDNNADAAVAYTDLVIFGPLAKQLAERVGAKEIEHLIGEPRYHWTVSAPTDEALANLENENFINGSAMFRRTAYDEVGGYRLTERPEDADLFLRMIQKGYKAVYVKEPLLYYRQHSPEQANSTLLHNARIQELRNSLEATRKWADKLQRDIDATRSWSEKLQRDIDVIQPYAQKLERDNIELREQIVKLRP